MNGDLKDLERALRQSLVPFIKQVAADVAEGITETVLNNEQFSSEQAAEDSFTKATPTTGATPLHPAYVKWKARRFPRTAELPRVKTGAMARAFGVVATTDDGALIDVYQGDLRRIAIEQHTGSGSWVFPPTKETFGIISRPFIGVRSDVYQNIERGLDRVGNEAVQAMSNVILPPIVLAL